jgi:iron complex transport system permease protein
LVDLVRRLPRRLTLTPVQMLLLLGGLAVLCIVLFMTVRARGSWDFVIPYRGRKVWGMVLVAYAVAVSTVLFQTVTHNRILTPAIMGFDSLYQLVQTTLVFVLGGFAFATLPVEFRFMTDVVLMVGLSTLLFRWLFSSNARSLHLLVLVGIVFGALFRSLSNLMQRLINPNDFAVLADANFASFNAIDPTLLAAATALIGAASLLLVPIYARLDVLSLGRETAISLGVDHQRTVSVVLVIIGILVGVSTALVGPILFFGLLVANLAYVLIRDHRHAVILPAAVLLAIIALIGGQTVLEHGFGFDTALSIIIEFLGGIVFLVFLLRGATR